jgi:energy-coupling factor transport system substrate-specific component
MERQDAAPGSPRAGVWDGVAIELQTLRRSAGDPSYAQIARRVSQRREALGASTDAARLARTTVYDAFRTGRTRVDLGLVREIATSLGADDATVDGWISRDEVVQAVEATPGAPAPRQIAVLMVSCVAISLLGRVVVDVLHLPIYLDMVGTAIAAIALGPWRGAAVGATTNIIGVVLGSGLVSLPFMLVNVAGALVWGYGVRRFDLGRTLPRIFTLNVMVAVVCSCIAIPILLSYGGSVGQGQDSVADGFYAVVPIHTVAIGLSNLITSMGDKLIGGFVALVVISTLPVALRTGLSLVLTAPATD